MTRRILACFVAFLFLLLAGQVEAAGTVTGSCTNAGGGVQKCTYTWTSDGSGAVSGNAAIVSPGSFIRQVALVPGTAALQPDDNYDLTLLNSRSVDVLDGLGADLSNAAAAEVFDLGLFVETNATLQLVVANAGAANSGTIVIYWGGR